MFVVIGDGFADSRLLLPRPAISGVVKDNAGKPLRGARVTAESRPTGRISDSDQSGHYNYRGLEAGQLQDIRHGLC